MAKRFDLPRIPSTTKPSFFNHDTAKWGLIGDLVGTIGALAIGIPSMIMFGLPVGLALMAATQIGSIYLGAKHGAKIGMEKQERELTQGHVVEDPSYLNKGIVSGLAVGHFGGIVLSLLGGVPAIGLGLLGAVVGSVMYKHEQERDYDHAIALRNAQLATPAQQPVIAQGQGLGVQQSQYMNSVSPQEAQAMETQQMAAPARQGGYAQLVVDNSQNPALDQQR